jgi:carbonic anhydrase/acetyltransferase-like protein (isoleucine patch superfamily)
MILPYRGIWPKIHETAFVAPSADLIGDIELGAHSSVWFQCVIRGDVNWIRIGENTNIQDHSMLHVTRRKSPLFIGNEVTVGHRVTLHGCRIGNRILIGMGAIVMDDVEIGDECIIGAGTLITQRSKIPPKSLVFGSPGRVIRLLTEQELAFLPKSAANYVADGIEYHGSVPGPTRLGSNNADLEVFIDDFASEIQQGMPQSIPKSIKDSFDDGDPGEQP